MKTLKRQLRRAFTIVELVVVIAVIAALAAILIPTFVNVMNNANQANDTSLVNYINTTLTAQEAKGNTPDKVDIDSDGETDLYNVTTALNIVADNGVDVTKLDTTASNADFVYNATKNSFLYYTDDFTTLYNGEEPASDDKLVIVASSFDSSRISTASNAGLTISNYCVYCTSGSVTLTDSSTTVTVWLYGTNNTTFTVNLPNGTAMDYCNGSTVKIEAIYNNSFHVYGKYAELSLTKGHLVLESGAEISSLNILAATEVKLTYSEEATVSGYYAVSAFTNIYSDTDSANTVSVDTFVDSLNITSTGLVVENEDGTVSVDTTISGLGTENNPYNVTEDNIEYILSLSKTVCVSFEDDFTTPLTIAEGYNVVIDLNGKTISYAGTVITVEEGATLTIKDSGGSGSVTITKAGSGNTSANMAYAINNMGTLYLKSGSVNSSLKYAIGIYNNAGTLYINGGNVVASYSSTGLTYGMFNAGTLYITDGTIESANSYGLYNHYGGTAYVSGGNINGKSYAVCNYGYGADYSEVYISGGTVSGTTSGVYCNSYSNTYVTGGTISDLYIYTNTGTTYVTILASLQESVTVSTNYGDDGTANGDGYAVVTTSTTINVDGASLEATSYSVYMTEESAHAYVEHNGEKTYYTTLKNAMGGAAEGDKVVLLKDSVYSGSVSKTLTIDLNGKNIVNSYTTTDKTESHVVFTVSENGTLNLINGDSDNVSEIIDSRANNEKVYTIRIQAGGTLTVGDNVKITSTYSYGITMWGTSSSNVATLTINGGEISAYAFAVCDNGGSKYGYDNITINSGTITSSNSVAIYLPGYQNKTYIYGGTITGLTGVEIRSGSLTIEGGTFTATAESFSATANSSGSTTVGAAIAVSQHTTNYAITVTISGGTFNGYYAVYEEDLQDETTEDIEISITGGTFNGYVYSENITIDKLVNGYTYNTTVLDNDKTVYTLTKAEEVTE